MAMNEQHYTPSELAKKWHLSASFILSLREEHGEVLVIDRPEAMHKRRYRSFRIPQSAALEIYCLYFMPPANRNKVRRWSEPIISGQQTMNQPNSRPVEHPNSVIPAPEITIFTRHNRAYKHRRD